MFLKTPAWAEGEFLPRQRWISRRSRLRERAVSVLCRVPNLGGGKRGRVLHRRTGVAAVSAHRLAIPQTHHPHLRLPKGAFGKLRSLLFSEGWWKGKASYRGVEVFVVEKKGLVLCTGHLGGSGLEREFICSHLDAGVVSPCCRDSPCRCDTAGLYLVQRLYSCPKAQSVCVQGLNKPKRSRKSQSLPFPTANFSTKPLLLLNQRRKIWHPWSLHHPKSFANNFATLSTVGASWCFRCLQQLGEQSRRWPLVSHPLEARVQHTRHPKTDPCRDAIRCSPFIFMSLFSLKLSTAEMKQSWTWHLWAMKVSVIAVS